MPRYDMTPPPVNLRLTQGDEFKLTFTIRNPPVLPAVIGTPVDLNGASVAFTMRKPGLSAGSAYVGTVTLTDAVNGTGEGLFTGAFTLSIPLGVYDWALRWTDSLGSPRTFASGTVEFEVKP